MGLFRRLALLALFGALIVGPVQADQVRVDFTSEVTSVSNPPVLGVTPSVGDPVSGFILYDLDAVDQQPGDPSLGFYPGATVSVSIGGVTFTNNLPALAIIEDGALLDRLSFGAGGLFGQPDILVGGVPTAGSITLNFESTSNPLTSDALPTTIPIPPWEIREFAISDLGDSIVFESNASFQVTLIPDVPGSSRSGLIALSLLSLVALSVGIRLLR